MLCATPYTICDIQKTNKQKTASFTLSVSTKIDILPVCSPPRLPVSANPLLIYPATPDILGPFLLTPGPSVDTFTFLSDIKFVWIHST